MAFAAPLLLALAIGAPPKAPVLDCSELPSLFDSFHRIHYGGKKAAQAATVRSVEEFIKNLDPSRALLLESEVERLKKDLPVVFSTMKDGSCPALNAASKLVILRTEADEQYVRQLLQDPAFKIDRTVELNLDPEKRGYPKTEAARKDFVRRLVHFQVANFVNAKMDLDAAKKRVLHRYELATKRQREYLAPKELPSLFAEAYASALDPHSSFFTADALEDFQIHMRLSLEGIGAVLRSEDGFTIIQSLVPGGQADKQGVLRPQDKIIAVAQDGEEPVDVIDRALRDVVDLIRGKKGTKVTLSVLREGKKTETFTVSIVRDQIDVKEQAAKITYETRKIGDKTYKVGVIDLPSFYGGDEGGRSSYRDVKRLLHEAVQQRVDGVVLDLSKNGGGLLKDAVNISGLFLRKGAIVATRSFDEEFEVLEDNDASVAYTGPLVVLTSPLSASGAEILAGALRDYNRALIVGGEQTFGKGTVQVLNTLPSGVGAMKTTTGMFFLPSGSSTQQQGVRSDIRIPSLLNRDDIGEKRLEYSLVPESVRSFASDSVNSTDAADRWTRIDPTLVRAIEKRSTERVKKNAVLQKIESQLKEESKNRGVVRLDELMKETKKSESDDGKEEVEAMEKAFLDEGVSILIDLVTLQSEKGKTLAQPEPSTPRLREGPISR